MPLGAALGILLGSSEGLLNGSELVLGAALGILLGSTDGLLDGSELVLGTTLGIVDGSADGAALNTQSRSSVQSRHTGGTSP